MHDVGYSSVDTDADRRHGYRKPKDIAGIAGAVGPPLVELDDEALNQYLTEAGRRTLGLRTSRRPARSS